MTTAEKKRRLKRNLKEISSDGTIFFCLLRRWPIPDSKEKMSTKSDFVCNRYADLAPFFQHAHNKFYVG